MKKKMKKKTEKKGSKKKRKMNPVFAAMIKKNAVLRPMVQKMLPAGSRLSDVMKEIKKLVTKIVGDYKKKAIAYPDALQMVIDHLKKN